MRHPLLTVAPQQSHSARCTRPWTGPQQKSRPAEAPIVPEKKEAGNSRKGSSYQEPAESEAFLTCRGLGQVLRPTADFHKRKEAC